jgi:hypothetical protein
MLETVYPYLLALFPPTVLVVTIIRLLLRTDLQFVARRRIQSERVKFTAGAATPEADLDRVHYTFAVHNAEEVPLEGRITIRLEVILDDGQLIATPTLLCGPHVTGLETTFAKDKRSFEIVTTRLRAQSTWIIHCVTNGKEGDIRLRVTYAKEGAQEGTYKEPAKWVVLGSQRRGQRETGQWFWMVAGTLLALLTYVAPIYAEVKWPRAAQPWKSEVDGPLLGALLVCSALAFWLCRQRPGHVILGHLGWERNAASSPASNPPADPPPA